MSTHLTESAEKESHFLLIVGPPGGGKGTISNKILKVRELIFNQNGIIALVTQILSCYNISSKKNFSTKDFPVLHHISSGDILREHVRKGTDIGKKAKECMDKGGLVPDEVMIDLVMADAKPYMEQGKSLLLDGFPRTLQQAMSLDKVTSIDMVINLNIPMETIVARIADRYVAHNSLFLQNVYSENVLLIRSTL